MSGGDRYELIDFGSGRKLESFAGYLVDRPSPAAGSSERRDANRWSQADARFDEVAHRWRYSRDWPETLLVDCGAFHMPIRPTPFGHVGLFPEQSANWAWLAADDPPSSARVDHSDPPRQALNLFAYTGAATMALVAAGYSVAHVDAAKPNVQAARLAAEQNGWSQRPIRFLVEDAAKFTAREVRRGRRYRSIVLDPPAYGHSPQGRAWRLQRDLWPLLQDCLRLLDPDSFRLLITGHSSDIGPDRIAHFVQDSREAKKLWVHRRLRIESGRSQLKDRFGRRLDAGFFVRVWSA